MSQENDLKNYCKTMHDIALKIQQEFTELGASVDLTACINMAQHITAANIMHDVYLPTILQALEKRTASGLFKP